MPSAATLASAAAAALLLVHAPGSVLGACNFAKTSVATDPGFTIAVEDDYKVLEDSSAGVKYGLYCDSQPSGVSGVDRWFKVPVQSVGLRIPIASGFVEALGHRDLITAAAAPGNLTNICIDTSKLQTLDTDGSSSDDDKPDVDVVFSASADTDGDRSVRLPSDDSLSPLQKAEWIKFVAAFFNDEESAESLFGSIADAYNCHWGNLQHIEEPHHAYWVQYVDGEDDSDAKKYRVFDSPYQKDLLAGAGATNDTRSAVDSNDLGNFQDAIKDAEFVFDQSNLTERGQRISEWYKTFGYTDPQNSDVSFLRSRNIWSTDKYTSKDGVSNFAEFAYVRPDLVLQDVISVIEPTYDPDHSRRWLLWLGGTNEKSTVIGSDNYDCDKPWITSVSKCTARSDFTGDGDGESDDGSDSGDKDSGSGSSGRTGKIVGGVIGAVAAVVLIIVAAHYYNRRRRDARIRVLAQSRYGGEGAGLPGTQHFD